MLAGNLDQGCELRVAFLALSDIAGVDAVLVQRRGAVRILRQQFVSVEVKVADQRHAHAHAFEALAHFRHGTRRVRAVHGDAHQFRTGARQVRHLRGGGHGIRRVGVGHGLHHHRRAAADGNGADLHACARTAVVGRVGFGHDRSAVDDDGFGLLQ